jgi:hypothetical protein
MPLFARSKKKTTELTSDTGKETENSYHPPLNNFSSNQTNLLEIYRNVGTTMMPRRRDMVRIFGTPNRRSHHYAAVLDRLDDLNRYLDNTMVSKERDEMDSQLDEVLDLMGNLEQAVNSFIRAKGEKDKRANFMEEFLLKVIGNVRTNMISRVIQFRLKPPEYETKWYQVATMPVMKNIQVDDNMATGETGKGGINTVRFYQLNKYDKSRQGVFKAGKEFIKDTDKYKQYEKYIRKKYKDDPDTRRRILNEMGLFDISREEETEALTAQIAGIKTSGPFEFANPRLAERNVALHRLNLLLGENLIPWTELATQLTDGQIVKGSIMQKASGITAGGAAIADLFSFDGKDDNDPKKINVKDPNLQRFLSKLQVLDAIAFHVDRHIGNYFIQQDEKGNVIGIKGIDNDMAFGTRTDIDNTNEKASGRFAGLGQFVDKEIADRVMAIRPQDLVAALGDLLEPEDLAALIARFEKIKRKLSSVRLLKPDEWNDSTAAAMLAAQQESKKNNESTSYYGRLLHGLRNPELYKENF